MTASGEMRITLALLADDVEDPSIYKVPDGVSSAESSIGVFGLVLTSSLGSVHLAMMSARIYDLMARRVRYKRSNSLSSTDH